MNIINNDFAAACSNLQSYACICFYFVENACTNMMKLIAVMRNLLICFVTLMFILLCNMIFGYYVYVKQAHAPTMRVQLTPFKYLLYIKR